MIAHPNAPLIIAHHFDNAPGISMQEVRDENDNFLGWNFRAWPEALGPEPTQADVASWTAAWQAFVNDPVNSETHLDDIIRALIVKGLITSIDIDNAKRNRP